jgi:hypothetical protein
MHIVGFFKWHEQSCFEKMTVNVQILMQRRSPSFRLSDLDSISHTSIGEMSRAMPNQRTEFAATLASTNRGIESIRHDLEYLMTKSHVLSQNSGVRSPGIALPTYPPISRK